MNCLSIDKMVYTSLQCFHKLNNTGADVSDDNSDSNDLDIEKIASYTEGCSYFLKYGKSKWLLKYNEIEAYELGCALWF